jgi:hypothetical protein
MKAQALEETQRWVKALDIDVEGFARSVCFVHQVFDKRRPQPLIAMLGQDSDVQNPNLLFSSGNV